MGELLDTRICGDCSRERPVDAFRLKGGYRARRCNDCEQKRRRDYRRTKRTETNAYNRAYSAANPERRATYYLRARLRKHGITLAEYDAFMAAQGGVCAICERDEHLYIDHDHSTGVVRGLLCKRCNSAIGYLDDDFERVTGAAMYLLRAQAAQGVLV